MPVNKFNPMVDIFDGVAVGNRELAVSFARKFADFDEKQLDTIRRLLEEGAN